MNGRDRAASHNFDAARPMLAVSTAAGLYLMTRSRRRIRIAALAALAVLLLAGAAAAQEQRSSGGFLDNLFSRGEPPRSSARRTSVRRTSIKSRKPIPAICPSASTAWKVRCASSPAPSSNCSTATSSSRCSSSACRTIPSIASSSWAPRADYPPAQPRAAMSPPGPVNAPPAAMPGSRSDVFDPAQHPNAPGAPRVLGNEAAVAAPEPNADNVPPVGAPGGRAAGAPLDLSTLAGDAPVAAECPDGQCRADAAVAQLPPPPRAQRQRQPARSWPRCRPRQRRRTNTTWPTAMCCTRTTRWPSRPSAISCANIRTKSWCRTRNIGWARACSSASAIATRRNPSWRSRPNIERSGKAPDALLRLGQSLAALNQKEAACATLAEVGRKFPRASASVKRGVAQEQKRAHC